MRITSTNPFEGLEQCVEENVPLKPYTWYKTLVVAGAREHCLPVAYVAQLEAAESFDDSNGNRHARNMVMANEALSAAI